MSHLVPRAEAKLHAVYAGVAESIAPFLPGWDHRSPGAFFLAGIGLKLVLSAFASARVLWLALVILLAAIASKLIGCGLGAFTWDWGWP